MLGVKADMRCLHCGKKIGTIRQLLDRQFCSRSHRRQAKRVSARVVRDLESQDVYEDGWLATATAAKKRPPAFSAGSGILLVVMATLLVLFLPSGEQRPTPEISYSPRVGSIGDRITRALPQGSLRLREDFRSDLRNWQGENGAIRDGWEKAGKMVNIGRLRLWKPTLTLGDYNVHFEGEIEEKALGWAFRAGDLKNYYATKLHVDKRSGKDVRAEIIRYVMLDGNEVGRVRLPIPVVYSPKTVYDVRVRIKGDRFHTMLNGRLVDSWSDKRFRRGGFGFFAENGEQAALRYVALSERESFLDRFLSFSFLIAPVDLEPGLR